MKQVIDNQRAQCIAVLKEWGIVYVIVNGAATVRLGDDPRVLKADTQDGIPMTSAIPAQQSYVWWKGMLFAISDVVTNASVQVPGKENTGS